MKKIVYFIVMAAMFLCSCQPVPKEEYPYELEAYNGYTVVGTMIQKDNDGMCHVLTLTSENGTVSVKVSETTYKRYSLGDTVNETRPVNENEGGVNESVVKENVFKVVVIGNHEYITNERGGICHNEDCPCFEKEK